jgi:hypothetical protein
MLLGLAEDKEMLAAASHRPRVALSIKRLVEISMRLALLLVLVSLTPAAVFAHESKATAEGMTEEFATAEAMRLVPKGASVTDTSCRSQDVADSTRYRCTVTYSD